MKSGFVQCVRDTCLYYKADGERQTVMGVYVDELLVTGTSKRFDEVFKVLATLQIKDLGVVNKFLGMRLTHSFHGRYEDD